MKLKLYMLIGFLVVSLSTIAQEKYSLNYVIAFPTGKTADFIGKTSFRGVGFDYTHMMNNEWGLGVSAGLQTFYEDTGERTTTSGTETITANRYHYINSIPVYATGSYFFNESETFTPFASLGLGFMYNRQEQDLGLYTIEDDAWQFSVRPEIGFEYEVNYGWGIRTAFRYNYAAKAGDLEGLSHFAIAVGIIWTN